VVKTGARVTSYIIAKAETWTRFYSLLSSCTWMTCIPFVPQNKHII
jgi:hypothetical protein